MTTPNKDWPAFRFCSDGRAQVFQSEDDVPEDEYWFDHPSKAAEFAAENDPDSKKETKASKKEAARKAPPKSGAAKHAAKAPAKTEPAGFDREAAIRELSELDPEADPSDATDQEIADALKEIKDGSGK